MIHALLFVIVASATPTPHAQRTAPPSGIEIGPPMSHTYSRSAHTTTSSAIFAAPPHWARTDAAQFVTVPEFEVIGTWANRSQSVSVAENAQSKRTAGQLASDQINTVKKQFSSFRLQANEAQTLCGNSQGRFLAYSIVARNVRYVVEQMYASERGRAYAVTYQRPYGTPESRAARQSMNSLCPSIIG